MKKFVIQVLVLLVVTFGALAFATAKLPALNFLPDTRQQTVQFTVGSNFLNIEVADNADKRKKGLSGRDSLATDSGMLFVYPAADKYIFWMKGMKFPLDFIWIRENKVVDILKNIPPPTIGQSDADLPRYAPTQPVDQILEVNSGFIDAHGIILGDKVERSK